SMTSRLRSGSRRRYGTAKRRRSRSPAARRSLRRSAQPSAATATTRSASSACMTEPLPGRGRLPRAAPDGRPPWSEQGVRVAPAPGTPKPRVPGSGNRPGSQSTSGRGPVDVAVARVGAGAAHGDVLRLDRGDLVVRDGAERGPRLDVVEPGRVPGEDRAL